MRRIDLADYEAHLLERFTDPLGMDCTCIELTPGMLYRLAPPHSSYSVATSNWDAPTLTGPGAIYLAKLDVHGRLEAIQKARDLKLI